jgi:D-alanine-D-alanine ligase
VDAAKEIALAAWKGLGCRDAGRVDLRQDKEGVPNLLEVNPLSGLHPQHSDLPILCTQLGIPYRDLIGRIVDFACRRLPARDLGLPTADSGIAANRKSKNFKPPIGQSA